ncbi:MULTISPECIES: hypothetical protein [unclassified Nostoc]|nr:MULTISPECIES: hypothetical protein [unclassified Nostoc]
MLEFEDAYPQKFAQLVTDAPDWVEWMGYESGDIIVSIFANFLS